MNYSAYEIARALGIRYDGVQSCGPGRPLLAQFTDNYEPRTPAHGATFYVQLDQITTMVVLGKWAEVIRRFKS